MRACKECGLGYFGWWQVNCFIRTKHLEMSFISTDRPSTSQLWKSETSSLFTTGAPSLTLPHSIYPSWGNCLIVLLSQGWFLCQSRVSSVPITKHMSGLKLKIRGPYIRLLYIPLVGTRVFSELKKNSFLFQFCEVFHFVQLLPRGSKKGLFPSSFQVRVTSCPTLPWPEQMLRT